MREKFKEVSRIWQYSDWSNAKWAQLDTTVEAKEIKSGDVVDEITKEGITSKVTAKRPGYLIRHPDNSQQLLPYLDMFHYAYRETADKGIFRTQFPPILVLPVDENITFQIFHGEIIFLTPGDVLTRSDNNDYDIDFMRAKKFRDYKIVENNEQPLSIPSDAFSI